MNRNPAALFGCKNIERFRFQDQMIIRPVADRVPEIGDRIAVNLFEIDHISVFFCFVADDFTIRSIQTDASKKSVAYFHLLQAQRYPICRQEDWLGCMDSETLLIAQPGVSMG